MRSGLSILAGAAAMVAIWIAPAPVSAQAAKGSAKAKAYRAPRTKHGTPDLQGTWFTNSGAAARDVEEHPSGLGIVAGPNIILDTPDKKIPYQPWALVRRKDLIVHHAFDDPRAHCYASGVPRVITYENFHLFRFIPTDRPPAHLPEPEDLHGRIRATLTEGEPDLIHYPEDQGAPKKDRSTI